MPPYPVPGMWMLLVPMVPTLLPMLLMMEGIPMNRDGSLMVINYRMSGFPMILECLRKFMPTPSNHKAGGMRKEHPRIGPCKLPMTTPIGRSLIRSPVNRDGLDGRLEDLMWDPLEATDITS